MLKRPLQYVFYLLKVFWTANSSTPCQQFNVPQEFSTVIPIEKKCPSQGVGGGGRGWEKGDGGGGEGGEGGV